MVIKHIHSIQKESPHHCTPDIGIFHSLFFPEKPGLSYHLLNLCANLHECAICSFCISERKTKNLEGTTKLSASLNCSLLPSCNDHCVSWLLNPGKHFHGSSIPQTGNSFRGLLCSGSILSAFVFSKLKASDLWSLALGTLFLLHHIKIEVYL